MNAILNKISRVSLVALSLFLWSCDNLGQTTAPETLDPKNQAVFSTSSGEQYVIVQHPVGMTKVSGRFGPAGGELHLGPHKLVIPAGAVSEPTTFAMSRLDGELLRFRFHATRFGHNDVGAAGFAVPVKLTVDFGSATGIPSGAAEDLKVIYFRPDGLVDLEATTVDVVGTKATAELGHFSDFGLAWPSRTLRALL
jgi:hypothetical protein